MLWPCPVKWEWESGYNAWLPFYYSPRWSSSPATPPAPPRSAAVGVKRAARAARLAAGIRSPKIIASPTGFPGAPMSLSFALLFAARWRCCCWRAVSKRRINRRRCRRSWITSLRCWPAATSCAWTAGAAMCRTMSKRTAMRAAQHRGWIRRRQGIGSCRRSPGALPDSAAGQSAADGQMHHAQPQHRTLYRGGAGRSEDME